MSAIDTEFYAAFAGRVRHQLATTRSTAPEGDTMSDTRTVQAAAIPTTFQAAPDAPCESHTWCIEKGAHLDHMGRKVGLPTEAGMAPILEAYFYSDQDSGLPTLTFDSGHDVWQEYTSGDQLRAQTAKVRAHLARLDAFADQFDAIREADGDVVDTEGPFDPAAIRRVVIEAALLSEGSLLVVKQYGEVLRIGFNPDQISEEQALDLAAQRVGRDLTALTEDDALTLAPGGTCTFALANGSSVSLYRPAWAEGDDPSEDNLTPDELRMRLEDLHHARYYPALRVDAANLQQTKGRYRGPAAILCPQMDVRPYTDDMAERIPTVTVEISEGSDDWIENLDPAGVRDLADKLRAQAAILDQAADDLTAARADWAVNGRGAK